MDINDKHTSKDWEIASLGWKNNSSWVFDKLGRLIFKRDYIKKRDTKTWRCTSVWYQYKQ